MTQTPDPRRITFSPLLAGLPLVFSEPHEAGTIEIEPFTSHVAGHVIGKRYRVIFFTSPTRGYFNDAEDLDEALKQADRMYRFRGHYL
jgi:hypothetical protein